MKSFEGKVAVITGGAGGLGRAFADRAQALGMSLVLSDIDAGALEKTRSALAASGARVAVLAGDISKAEHATALAGLAQREFGGVHCLFNNAGVGCGGFVWENTLEDWDWVMGVNVMGVVHGLRAFTPLMLEAAKRDPGYEGHIVNVASVAGLLTPPLLGIYNVSKHAVVALTETLHHDLALVSPQVKASVLCPGFTPSGIANSHRNRPASAQSDAAPTASMLKAQAMVAKAVESGKLTAQDVANATFDAIRDERFWIFTHPAFKPLLDARLDDMRALSNPRGGAGMRET
ncbi:MAG: SDR family NAD(P)-dependent oxidoreductase [Betaproteobacteria bacterium]|nr:SDR family NAD(P)-dependent oxidoreductase [Betaproteobacteria bacterium]